MNLLYSMKKILHYLFLLCFLNSFSQVLLHGEVGNSGDTEGIHVFNKTYQKYTITDEKGKFLIPVRVNDTLVLSAIQYQLKRIVITKKMLANGPLYIMLETKVNELDAVYIKPKLSGNLLSDSQRIHTTDKVTAITLGLPNAHVKPPSAPERKLYTATHTGGGLPLEALINAINGRTKMLKKQVARYKKVKLENSVFENFKSILLNDFGIPNDKLYDFLYYSSNDTLFAQIVKTNSKIVIYDFLQAKAVKYRALQKLK